uniref:Calcineurin like phosphoesterase n=1 Tax=Marseillevirus sp. TaxID=2809551 RepID=A0AA96ELA5_9VIRU|nr:calcineurin like phosphoesterase [Marseillevirus sp.]
MELCLLSDCHLELSPQKLQKFLKGKLLVPNKKKVLCLCGDIGNPWSKNYSKFLAWCSESFEFVFVVAGNHEYYGEHTMEETDQRLYELSKSHSNVEFLQNSSFEYKGVLFVGSTLWTDVPDDADELMNDYLEIPEISPELIRCKWNNSASFLLREISKGKKTVVLTHHCPLDEDKPLGDKQDYRECYCSNLGFLAKENVAAWFWGHTHVPFYEKRGNTVFASNPKGYTRENVEWKQNFFVTI